MPDARSASVFLSEVVAGSGLLLLFSAVLTGLLWSGTVPVLVGFIFTMTQMAHSRLLGSPRSTLPPSHLLT